jgi:peptidoglycan/xylan/chitin deacetylase (PgdA/CDA1 family)
VAATVRSTGKGYHHDLVWFLSERFALPPILLGMAEEGTGNGARAALCLTFDNMGRARDIGEGRAAAPDPASPDLAVGYPRLLGLLAELGLRGTFFIEGWNALHHAERVEELAARGHEVGLHGWVHEKFAALDALRAEQLLYDGTAALSRLGLRPAGFRAPGALRGAHTIPVLRALGYSYDSSRGDAQEPQTEPALLAPGLAHVPWRDEMVDSIQYLRHPERPRTPAELQAMWLSAIDAAAASGATLTLVIHAFVSGVDEERFAVVRRALTHACSRGDLEITTAGSLAARVLSANNPGRSPCSS